ncbi:MAG: integrase arm-type DNA-binding domain-containing protein [Pseudomonadota bacterium]|nr:integrase arm-type DNA-binding domain-containing protein [Pseudomonadota bacterium]
MAPRDRLSAAFIKSAKPGKHCDGAGLWFHKRADGGAQWFLRFDRYCKRCEMGLGGFPRVSLKQARGLAETARSQLAAGIDPIKERRRLKREALQSANTFEHLAYEAFEARKSELKDDGKNGRWFTPLALHVLPKLGLVPVEEITPRDLRDCIGPLWHEKADTARNALNRTNIVIRHAAALGLDVDIGLAEKTKLLLGKTRHVVKHILSMPWQKAPNFNQSLDDKSLLQLALRLLMLTGLRSYPVRHAHLDEIDRDIWTIPGEKMKGRRGKTENFRAPISPEALHFIELASQQQRDGHIFPDVKSGVIYDASMARLMERRGHEAGLHGFCSMLRLWRKESQQASREVAETIIAHQTGSLTERAYNRTDFLEQRRGLMEAWERHLKSAN